MAVIHKFLSLQTEGAGGTLIVRGETVDEDDKHVDLGADAQIFVAVIRVGHPTNRADLEVEEAVEAEGGELELGVRPDVPGHQRLQVAWVLPERQQRLPHAGLRVARVRHRLTATQ